MNTAIEKVRTSVRIHQVTSDKLAVAEADRPAAALQEIVDEAMDLYLANRGLPNPHRADSKPRRVR